MATLQLFISRTTCSSVICGSVTVSVGGDGGRRAEGAALGVEVGGALLAEVGVAGAEMGLSTNFFGFATLAVAATRGAAVAVVTTVSSSR